MTQPLPPPPIELFQRLQVTDGLLMTADRWRQAHEYHRRRQNVHYQALNQPGVVCGLGVHVIAPPADVPGKFQDGRWLQIQPGIAIDLAGNPIIVPQPIDFRITTKPVNSTPLLVYLVLSYVDPDSLNRQEPQETVEETFRIDEKNSPPEALEVEVCRILLQPGTSQLEYPTDVFAPGLNQLDFRYRTQAQARPQATVRVAQVVHGDSTYHQRGDQLATLMQAIAPLYPALQGAPVEQVRLSPQLEFAPYDLLYLTGKRSLLLQESEILALKAYLAMGGVLLVDVPIGGTDLAKSILSLAQQIGTPLEYLARLNRTHPLRTQPFVFAALPQLGAQPIQVLTGGGIVLIIGDLASAWGIDEALSLPRETIRTAQEFGINILHYAWKRRHWTALMSSSPAVPFSPPLPLEQTPLPEPNPPSPSRSKSSIKTQNIFDQLL